MKHNAEQYEEIYAEYKATHKTNRFARYLIRFSLIGLSLVVGWGLFSYVFLRPSPYPSYNPPPGAPVVKSPPFCKRTWPAYSDMTPAGCVLSPLEIQDYILQRAVEAQQYQAWIRQQDAAAGRSNSGSGAG